MTTRAGRRGSARAVGAASGRCGEARSRLAPRRRRVGAGGGMVISPRALALPHTGTWPESERAQRRGRRIKVPGSWARCMSLAQLAVGKRDPDRPGAVGVLIYGRLLARTAVPCSTVRTRPRTRRRRSSLGAKARRGHQPGALPAVPGGDSAAAAACAARAGCRPCGPPSAERKQACVAGAAEGSTAHEAGRPAGAAWPLFTAADEGVVEQRIATGARIAMVERWSRGVAAGRCWPLLPHDQGRCVHAKVGTPPRLPTPSQ